MVKPRRRGQYDIPPPTLPLDYDDPVDDDLGEDDSEGSASDSSIPSYIHEERFAGRGGDVSPMHEMHIVRGRVGSTSGDRRLHVPDPAYGVEFSQIRQGQTSYQSPMQQMAYVQRSTVQPIHMPGSSSALPPTQGNQEAYSRPIEDVVGAQRTTEPSIPRTRTSGGMYSFMFVSFYYLLHISLICKV